MTVGHTIGNRSHIIEKKRDKDGRVRQQQKFVNLDTEEAENFNNEFKTRVAHNLGYGNTSGSSRKAIEKGPSSGHHNLSLRNTSKSQTSGPIITVPDDDDDEDIQYISPRG